MSVRVHGFALRGIEAVPCEIEVDLSGQGLPRTTLVGLPDVAVREAIDRVQTAVANAGFDWPGGRVTINLAPADLRKEGPAFDLPMALSVLVAGGALRRAKGAESSLASWLIAGELALDGRVRPVRGAICLAILAREAGFERVMVARENLAEAGRPCQNGDGPYGLGPKRNGNPRVLGDLEKALGGLLLLPGLRQSLRPHDHHLRDPR